MKKILLILLVVAVSFFMTATAFAQINQDGLVSYWNFDESSGTTAYDSVGNNDGTIYGATWASGITGGALSFDGIDDYVIVPDDSSLDLTTELTIQTWINSTSTYLAHVIVSKWNNDINDSSYIFKDWQDSENLSIELSKSIGHDLAYLESTTSIPLNTWINVAATYNSNDGSIKIYLNGIENASLTIGAGQPIHAGSADLLIGAVFNNGVRESFSGRIDELTIYNRALTASEITANYNSTVIPEPISSILFITGGAVLTSRRYFRSKIRGRVI